MQAIEQLSQRPGIGFAEKNWLIQTRATSNDPAVSNGSTRGLHGESSSPVNAFGSRSAEARGRGFTGSATVVVGVIDEGLQINHPDLVGNVGANPGAISGNGIEDDGTADDHGTHVAGTTANAIRAVDYFTDLKTRHGLNLVATNNSRGGGGYSQGLYAAINRANSAGIFFVAAAGNSASSTLSYPAAHDLPNVGGRRWHHGHGGQAGGHAHWPGRSGCVSAGRQPRRLP
jgi:hypothetical protein